MNDADRLVESLQPTQMVPLESDVLVPTLKGQLESVRDMFIKIQTIARRPELLDELDLAISRVVPSRTANARTDASKYLDDVASQIQTDFIDPITEAVSEASGVTDLVTLRRWLTKVRLVASTVVRNRELLFVYKARAFVLLRNPTTDEQVCEPREWDISVYPFIELVRECARIADAMAGSITGWVETQRELVLRTANLRAADAARDASVRSGEANVRSAEATRAASLDQLRTQRWLAGATIGLSFVFMLLGTGASDWWAQRSHVRDLEAKIGDMQVDLQAAQQKVGSALSNKEACERQLSAMKAAETPPAIPVMPEPEKHSRKHVSLTR